MFNLTFVPQANHEKMSTVLSALVITLAASPAALNAAPTVTQYTATTCEFTPRSPFQERGRFGVVEAR